MNKGVFLVYLKSLGTFMPILVAVTLFIQMASDLGSNIWLSEWSKDDTRYGPNETMDPNLPNVRVGVYGGLGGTSGKS